MACMPDKVARSWSEALAHIPDLTNGFVLPRSENGTTSVLLQRTTRDVSNDRRRSTLETIHYVAGLEHPVRAPFPVELPPGTLAVVPSPSGCKLAVLSKGKRGNDGNDDDCFLEFWTNGLLERSIALVNRVVVTDAMFGGLSWSPDERFVLFVAERKREKPGTLFAPTEGNDATAKFDFEASWGEQYKGRVAPRPVLCSIESGTFSDILVPAEMSCGQPVFAEVDGTPLCVFVAWPHSPRKLGIIYCYQRPSRLFATKLAGTMAMLQGEQQDEDVCVGKDTFALTCDDGSSVRSPRPNPRLQNEIAFLRYPPGGDTHGGAAELSLLRMSGHGKLAEIDQIVRASYDPRNSQGCDDFPGLYLSALPSQCWDPSGESLVLTSQWRSHLVALRVWTTMPSRPASRFSWHHGGRLERRSYDLSSGHAISHDPSDIILNGKMPPRGDVSLAAEGSLTASPLADAGSCVVLSVGAGGDVLLSLSTPSSPATHWLLPASSPIGEKISPSPVEMFNWTSLGSFADLDATMSWSVLELEGGRGEAILAMPRAAEARPPNASKPPLVLLPHGGPHSCYPSSFARDTVFLVSAGYATLRINYRGSTGFGDVGLRTLPGQIGTQDVSDCITAARAVLDSGLVGGAGKVAAVGGSHGGFLSAHLSALSVDAGLDVACACLRNPVTNIAAMVGVTDIPDWCFIECGGIGAYDFGSSRPATPAELTLMYNVSPVSKLSNVSCPTLICLGGEDKRVPPSQGLEWYHSLRSKGVACKLLWFPNDHHAIDRPLSEGTMHMETLKWLQSYFPVQA